LVEYCDHAIRIEAAIRKVDVCVDADLELAALFRGRRIDSRRSQASEMVRTLMGVNNVSRLMATLEPIPYEWEQDPILFVVAVEEGTDVAGLAELGTGERNGSGELVHGISPTGYEAARGIRMHYFEGTCPTRVGEGINAR
jgi:hypothetical protein